MTPARARWLARGLFAFMLAEIAVAIFLQVLQNGTSGKASFSVGDAAFLLAFMLFPIVGLVLASRKPDNAVGWLMLSVGVIAFQPITGYGTYALTTGAPGGAAALGLSTWTWIPMIGLAGGFTLLLFPDGHLPSPRWRWFARVIATGMFLGSLAFIFAPGNFADQGFPKVVNPLGVESLKVPLFIVSVLGIASVFIGVIGSAISLRVRYRRSEATQRLQIRWLATAAIIVAGAYVAALVASAIVSNVGAEGSGLLNVIQSVGITSFGLLPISIGFAVLKYRLYEIDVVLKKTVIVGLIAAFVTVVYAIVVVGAGSVAGGGSAFLSALTAAIVAIAFLPVLARARVVAARMVYGKRATPLETLSNFSSQVADVSGLEDILPRMTELIMEGTGATRAEVWLHVGGRFVVEAARPDAPGSMAAATMEDIPGDFVAPVRYRGEELGAVAITKTAADPISPSDEHLLTDLASQAALVLRNVRLVEELRASRQRLVAAQDEERRKIERNLHDGAQQQLIALGIKVNLAKGLASKDADKATRILEGVQSDLQDSIDTLRDLARGIYPPLLADQGLASALEAQARKATVLTTVEANGIARYSQEVEAAAYFCCLEAMQNISKYANATRATILLSASDQELTFTVTDDGDGFDTSLTNYGTGMQGMADRLDAIGGRFDVQSSPGAGTTVTGMLPAARS